MFCEECLKEEKEIVLKRDKKWLPEVGLDPLLRKYDCESGHTCFVNRGRVFKIRQEEPPKEPKEPKEKGVKKPKKPTPGSAPTMLPEPKPEPVAV